MSRTSVKRLAFLLLLAGSAPSEAQVVDGGVVSLLDGRAVPAARVDLVDLDGHVVTTSGADSEGRFSIRAPTTGSYHLHADAAGFFAVFEGPLDLTEGARITVEVALRPDPVSLDPVDVTVEYRSARLAETGFYLRRAAGDGFHLDRERIEQRPSARTLSELLRGVPGVQVDSRGYVQLRGMSSLQGRCHYRVYLDGVLVVSRTAWDEEWPRSLIRPEDVEGIEILRRPSEVPAQYSGGEAGCGVILIWSRR